jgi:hypothetical protein
MAYGPFNTGFRGTVNGAIQTVVTDQPGLGVPGELCFASDNTLVDSFLAGGDVAAGLGIVTTFNAGAAEQFQNPGELVSVPAATGLTIADFKGIVVFDENMQSDASGNPGWADGRVARVLRPNRVGGRIWIKALDTWTRGVSTVNWVVTGGTDGKYQAGEFAPAALAGNATYGYSVAITAASVKTSAVAGGVVAIELNA